jgi:transposase
MKLDQLETLVRLMRGKMSSLSAQSAKLVLVDGMSQVDAAKQLGTKPNTVNNGIKRYKEADEEIKKAYLIRNT